MTTRTTRYFEPSPGARLDATRLVSACIEAGASEVLLDAGALAPEFFDLRTGVAGEVLHKLGMYRIRLAGVVPDPSAHSASFQAFLREANSGSQFRFFATREDALAWLAGRSEATDPHDLAEFYRERASWWPLFSAPADYAEEAALYERTLRAACAHPPSTLLELGSGGGNNASHLKARFRMTLVDLSPGMLEVSRSLNPECEHVLGDMRSARLGRSFDCVLVHDAVGYMTTETDLRAAIGTAFVHCAPGGAALFVPDHLRESFAPSTGSGGHDGEDGRALRYLEWTWDPDPADTTYVADYAFLLRERDGSVQVHHERHVEGLFSRADWLRFLTEAGFEPSVVPLDHSELEPGSYEALLGRRPAGLPSPPAAE